MKYKYKNLSDQDLTVIGVGVVPAGAEFVTSQRLTNTNFQFTGTVDGDKGTLQATQAPQPNQVTEAEKTDKEIE